MRSAFTPRNAAALCLLVSAALLAGAHIFQALGYEPCPLCMDQRRVHWLALLVGAVTLLAAWRAPLGGVTRALTVLLALVYLGSAGLAAYHAGVEWHFWPGPPCEAGAGGPITADSILESLENPTRAVPCDQAAWRLLGISMAGYNAVFSALLMLVALAGAFSTQRKRMFM